MSAAVGLEQLLAFASPAHERHAPEWIMLQGERHEPLERPERVQALARALAELGVETRAPAPVGEEELLSVHRAELIEHLRDGWLQAQARGRADVVVPDVFAHPRLRPSRRRRHADVHAAGGELCFDCSSPLLEGTWAAAVDSAALALAGARALLDSARLAYALCRPPGHHAGPDFYGGFCYLNNAALAARLLGRAAVLDVDIHHGNGTQAVFFDDPDVLTVSIHEDPAYAFPYYTGYADDGGVANCNLPLPRGTDEPAYLAALERALEAVAAHDASALVVAAGFDGLERDPLSTARLEAGSYEAIGRSIASLGLPTLVVQEGGYVTDEIGGALAALLRGLAEGSR